MKILKLIKIILISIILLPILIASGGFLDDLKSTGEVQKAKKACEKGDGSACFNAGEIFSKNPNVAKKESEAMWTKGCELGNLDSCMKLADKGDLKAAIKAGDLSKDKNGKRKWYGKACQGEELKGCEALCANGLFDDKLDGCIKLAEIEDKKTPEGEEANEEEIKLYLKACDYGNMLGCFNAAIYTKDIQEQKKLLDKSCFPNTPFACYYLSIWHHNNSDLKQAEYYMNMACKQYYDDSCEMLQDVRKEIADISNKESAAKMAPLLNEYKAACDKGDLNVCIKYGLQLPGTPDQKIPWFKKACDGGVPEGCFQLGKCFFDLGKSNDAIDWYIKACNGGLSEGCYYAGWMCLNKINKPADAKKYYLLACNSGHALACNNLGSIEARKGNRAEAAKYYAKACDGGNTGGCNNLAGIQIDFSNIVEARKILNEACDSGSNAACQKLLALTKAGW